MIGKVLCLERLIHVWENILSLIKTARNNNKKQNKKTQQQQHPGQNNTGTCSRNHSFSTFAIFSVQLTFLTPDTHMYVNVSRGKKR